MLTCETCHEPIDETDVGARIGGQVWCHGCIDAADPADAPAVSA